MNPIERRSFPRADREPLPPATRAVARWMFRLHLWLGVLCTTGVLVLCITGILLNHKRALGLMPDVPNVATGPLAGSLSIARLAALAGEAAPAAAAAGVDRMDVRPGDALIKVRFDDAAVTEGASRFRQTVLPGT